MIVRIDIEDYLDRDDIIELADQYDLQVIDVDGNAFGVDLKKLTMNDSEKMKVFIEKFQYVPLVDLEKFLNTYKL